MDIQISLGKTLSGALCFQTESECIVGVDGDEQTAVKVKRIVVVPHRFGDFDALIEHTFARRFTWGDKHILLCVAHIACFIFHTEVKHIGGLCRQTFQIDYLVSAVGYNGLRHSAHLIGCDCHVSLARIISNIYDNFRRIIGHDTGGWFGIPNGGCGVCHISKSGECHHLLFAGLVFVVHRTHLHRVLCGCLQIVNLKR